MNYLPVWIKKNVLYFAWIQVIVATVGSLYASDVLGWVPCSLCWYQRILIYPLGIIIPVGILLKDKNLPFYVLPLSILGMGVAFYQHLLQIGLIPEGLAPCSFGVSCTTKYFDINNFVTLPLLSLLGFAFIAICMLIFARTKREL